MMPQAMTRRATLVFPRTGQVIKLEVPSDQYEAITRRNQEIIRYSSLGRTHGAPAAPPERPIVAPPQRHPARGTA